MDNPSLFGQVIQHTLEEDTRYPAVLGSREIIDYPGYFHGVKMAVVTQM